MSELDPQLFFRVKDDQYLDQLVYEPQNVDVLDIVQFENGGLDIKPKTLATHQLEAWLDTTLLPNSQNGTRVVRGGLRLILGASTRQPPPSHQSPLSFPNDIHKIVRASYLPFSQSHFKLIIRKFRLPRATPWLFYTSTGHFQEYCLENGSDVALSSADDESARTTPQLELGSTPSPRRIGVTMRRSSRGILAIDLALSLSHHPLTGSTYAVLLGRSESQAVFMKQQIQELAKIAHHPAFSPTLVCTYHRTLLQRLCDKANNELFEVETASGQTWAPMYDERGLRPQGNCDDANVTKRALGVIQLTTAWEAYAKAVLSDVEAIQDFLSHVNMLLPQRRRDSAEAEAKILSERLRFLGNKGKSVLWKLQFIMQRAQAQQNAIYNYIALKNSEANSALAYDSRELAVASKRDSFAMKSISLITMVFLPGTFVATMFATPGIAQASPQQWVYWFITIPLTLAVLGFWVVWYRWTATQIAADSRTRERALGILKAR